ncbi:hypothetical protein [Pseudidiomarina donghaiensis]|uniref:hypothetical protein n=1 Tax=Pseudidiomarina donghaiensis TaxID=519452 RepID=UPI0015A60789|nr:hypothetical protein [Pseudidiomarina donghaiensis]
MGQRTVAQQDEKAAQISMYFLYDEPKWILILMLADLAKLSLKVAILKKKLVSRA